MKIRWMTTVLAVGLLMSSQVLAQDGLLSRPEKKVYHACLYAHYIDNYCRTHAWGFNHYSFRECVIANGACECVIANGGYWGPYVDDACRAVYSARRL
jgi:hypothetical protein